MRSALRPRPPSAYDNELHGGDPRAADAAAKRRIGVMLAQTKVGRIVVPAWMRRSVGSEGGALVAAEILYWFEPRKSVEEANAARGKAWRRMVPRTTIYHDNEYWMPASKGRLAQKLVLSRDAAGLAVKRLERLGWIETTSSRGETHARPRFDVIVAAYLGDRDANVAVQPKWESEQEAGMSWWAGSTRTMIRLAPSTILHFSLLPLVEGGHVEARMLRLILRWAGVGVNSPRDRKRTINERAMWETCAEHLGGVLGISDNAAMRSLQALKRWELIDQTTWGVAYGGNARRKTFLAPLFTEILERLKEAQDEVE